MRAEVTLLSPDSRAAVRRQCFEARGLDRQLRLGGRRPGEGEGARRRRQGLVEKGLGDVDASPRREPICCMSNTPKDPFISQNERAVIPQESMVYPNQ